MMDRTGLHVVALLSALSSMAPARAAPVFSWIYQFDPAQKLYPIGPVVFGVDGSLWGVAGGGNGGAGAVFDISTAGKLLHRINGDCTTFKPLGCELNGGLAVAPDGKVYGTAYVGPQNSKQENLSSIFRINPDGYPFNFSYLDPVKIGPTLSGLTYSNGTLYGLNNASFAVPGGVQGGPSIVFAMAVATKATAAIRALPDNLATAYSLPAVDASGNIWALAPGDDWPNNGGVFVLARRYTPATATWDLAASLDDSGDTGICNLDPIGKPLIAADGSVTLVASVNPNTKCFGYSGGLVVRAPAGGGLVKVLGGVTAATQGVAGGGVVADSAGALYGSTSAYGSPSASIVYCITPAGRLVTLARIAGPGNGGFYAGELTPDGSGSFYGTTSDGGNGNGGVFRITPGTACRN